MAELFSRKGCALGCGGVIAIGIIMIATTFTTMSRQYNRAAETRAELVESFGDRSEFDPWAVSGIGPEVGPAIPPDRLEVFLAVRHHLAGDFMKLSGANQAMRSKEGLQNQGAVPKRIFTRFFSTAFGAGNQLVHLGSFARERNRALLDNGMGFGEYAWIYALTYYGCLGETPILGSRGDDPGFMPSSARLDLANMMRRRADGLIGQNKNGSISEAVLAEAALWRAEADRLADNSYAVPFSGEAPASLLACIEEHRDELASFFSRDSDPLELMRLKKFGLGYEDR